MHIVESKGIRQQLANHMGVILSNVVRILVPPSIVAEIFRTIAN